MAQPGGEAKGPGASAPATPTEAADKEIHYDDAPAEKQQSQKQKASNTQETPAEPTPTQLEADELPDLSDAQLPTWEEALKEENEWQPISQT